MVNVVNIKPAEHLYYGIFLVSMLACRCQHFTSHCSVTVVILLFVFFIRSIQSNPNSNRAFVSLERYKAATMYPAQLQQRALLKAGCTQTFIMSLRTAALKQTHLPLPILLCILPLSFTLNKSVQCGFQTEADYCFPTNTRDVSCSSMKIDWLKDRNPIHCSVQWWNISVISIEKLGKPHHKTSPRNDLIFSSALPSYPTTSSLFPLICS